MQKKTTAAAEVDHEEEEANGEMTMPETGGAKEPTHCRWFDRKPEWCTDGT